MPKQQRLKPHAKSGAKMAAKKQVMVPDYYQKFQCIGADCEDTCCSGWRVTIDHATWQRYQKCEHETLAPMFRSVVVENEKASQSEQEYASVKLRADGRCSFLMSDMMCMIQKELGAEALSDTCASFPRYYNQFGEQREYALGVSCPEAARLVLLHPEPISLAMAAPDADLGERDFTSYRMPQNGTVDPGQIAILQDFRTLILGILQFRELTLGARVMTLGFLLDEMNNVVSNPHFKNAAEMLPVLSAFIDLFSDPSAIEAQFEQIPSDMPRKLQVTTGLISEFLNVDRPRFRECILAVADGLLGSEAQGTGGDAELLARYQHAYETYYLPYFRDKGYILENYLVNGVLIRLFPFTRASYLDLYREMVCNLAIIQVFLVGMASHYQGLNDARVVQLIQSFTRMSVHNSGYLSKLIEAVGGKGAPSFVDVMWMLKER